MALLGVGLVVEALWSCTLPLCLLLLVRGRLVVACMAERQPAPKRAALVLELLIAEAQRPTGVLHRGRISRQLPCAYARAARQRGGGVGFVNGLVAAVNKKLRSACAVPYKLFSP